MTEIRKSQTKTLLNKQVSFDLQVYIQNKNLEPIKKSQNV